MAKGLSTEELDSFHRDGFVVPGYRLPSDVLERLRALSGKLIADNAHLGDEPIACPHVPGSGVQKMKSDPGWIEFPTHGPIVDMVESVIGPDVVLWGTTFFHKAAGVGRVVPWHRDGRYWPIHPLATTSVWIAVEESVIENGCLRIIRGSHAARELGEHFSDNSAENAIPETLRQDEYDEADAVDIELEPGQMVMFDVYTVHGSNANRSGRHRTGYAMRYMPTTSHFDHHDEANRSRAFSDQYGSAHHTRPLTLLRGEDKCRRNDFRIGHPEAVSNLV